MVSLSQKPSQGTTSYIRKLLMLSGPSMGLDLNPSQNILPLSDDRIPDQHKEEIAAASGNKSDFRVARHVRWTLSALLRSALKCPATKSRGGGGGSATGSDSSLQGVGVRVSRRQQRALLVGSTSRGVYRAAERV